MKKILVLVLVMVATSTFTFAINPSDYGVFYKLNNKSTFTSLMNYLGADKGQANYLKEVFNVTADELQNASKTGNDKFADNVVNYNLYNTKCILSDNQYRMYLKIINLSVNNVNDDLLDKNNLVSDINK
ncbi:MAG: hypothetical protein P4L34_02825 [Paludibacter sp.]|nr:hypothetical protein [Paludibacter sp.]